MKWEIARIFVVGTGGSGFCAEAAPSGVIGSFMAVAPYSSFGVLLEFETLLFLEDHSSAVPWGGQTGELEPVTQRVRSYRADARAIMKPALDSKRRTAT